MASGEIDTGFAAELAAKDPKTAVNQFCQRFCKRPLTKQDIVYTTQKFPGGFQSTLKLVCIDGQEFAGELAPTQKDAEKTASQQVLTFYAEQINTMPKVVAAGKKKKRPASEIAPDPNAAAAHLTPKSELNSMAMKIMRTGTEKNQVVYETHQVVGGFQATVKLPGLPGEWGQQIWAGEVSSQRKDAEQSAASMALEAIVKDTQLMLLFSAPPKAKNWSPGQGKGKGKGKGGVNKGGMGLQVAAQAANQWNAAASMTMFGGLAPWS